MKLTVWIWEPNQVVVDELKRTWSLIAGNEVCVCSFRARPEKTDAPHPDLLMAELSGRCDEVTELLGELRQQAGTDFLPITAAREPSLFTKAQQYGAIDYILKPFSARRLRQSLRRYLRLKEGITAGCALTQKQLDSFFYFHENQTSQIAETLPPYSRELCRRLLTLLAEEKEQKLTAQGAAEKALISRVTARKYMEILVKMGYVKRSIQKMGRGRPQNIYELRKR